MGMGEFNRMCQIVRLCDLFCELETKIVHNARNDFGSIKLVILAELATILYTI